jgi:signal transduction histidine kinase
MFPPLRLQFVAVTIAILLCISLHSNGQQRYTLDDPSVFHRLDVYTFVFIDSTESLGIKDVSKPAFQQRFNRADGFLTFGYLKPAIWLKIESRTTIPETTWMLQIPAPFLEYVDFYQLQNNYAWHHSSSGYYKKQSEREIRHTNHVASLRFLPDSTNTIYIRIAGLSPKTFPVFIAEKEFLQEHVRFEDVGYGIFFGILIVMFFYNLLLYVNLRQIDYLLYICTIVCTFLIFASASGYGGRFLWPEFPRMNFYAGRLTLPLMAIFLSAFTIRFLEVRKYSVIMFYLLISLIPLAVLATILIVTKILPSAGNNLISLSTTLFMVTGIVCSMKGNKAANYFIAAWTIYLIGGLMLTLRNSGVLEFNFWTTHFVEIGAALETTIIAFALGDRYRRYKKEKEAAQMQALKLQLGATEKLESKVKERTEQLSKAYKELQQTLETNEAQTRIIENKNAELDAFFYRVSHDIKGPISSLLGLSALAKRESPGADLSPYLDRQHQQIERLNHIVTGLINLTRLSHTDLQIQKIDFEKLIDACISSFRGYENYERIKFEVAIEPSLDFHCEWMLANSILQNLIENAIKYSRSDSPFVSVAVYSDGANVVIRVTDNGQGITAEHLPKIFEMFYRVSNTPGGSGLGLYILKRSVDRLGGTIEVASSAEIGSAFTVKLPRHDKN